MLVYVPLQEQQVLLICCQELQRLVVQRYVQLLPTLGLLNQHYQVLLDINGV
jgi:hypothetical protein